MAGHNSFSNEIRFFFSDIWECYWCGMNSCDCLHHIMGMGNGDSTCERSILNAGLFCNQKCHLPNHGVLMTKEWRTVFLNKTYDLVKEKGYQLKEVDNQFLEKYAELY